MGNGGWTTDGFATSGGTGDGSAAGLNPWAIYHLPLILWQT